MPKRRSIKTSSPSDFEPKRKNPISLGSDSNIDNDLKPLTIGGIPTGLEISNDTIASNVENFVTLKEKTQELNVSVVKGNKIPSITDPQLIFQNQSPTAEKAGLWFNIYESGTSMIKASDSSGNHNTILLFSSDFNVVATEGLHLSNNTGHLFDVGGTAESGETQDVRIYNTSNSNDFFKVIVEDNGVTTLSTTDGATSGTTDAGHMKFEPDGSFLLKEMSSAGADVAGYGQLWVKNDTPNNLYFVNDAGNEVQITDGSSLAGGGGGASALNDLSDVTYSSGNLTITSLDQIIAGGNLVIDVGSALTLDAADAITLNSDTGYLLFMDNTTYHMILDANLQTLTFYEDSDINDYFQIQIANAGKSYIRTVDSSSHAADLTFDIDGDAIFDMNSDASNRIKFEFGQAGTDLFQIKADASFNAIEMGGEDGNYSLIKLFGEGGSSANDYFQIFVEAQGVTEISTVDSSGANGILSINPDGQLRFDKPPRVKEQASADADQASYGQLWVKNDTPNNLYFTNDAGNDVQITNGSSLAGGGGGGGTDTWAPQWSTRWYVRYGYYYFPHTTYGPNFYNWSSASVSALTSWNDSYHPCIVVPKNLSVKSYHLHGNFTATNTYVLCIKKGTPTYGTAGNTSLSTLGTEQTLVVSTANIYEKIEETGLSVSLSAGDIIIPTLRRTTNTSSSSYSFCEGVLNIVGEYT